ncbi:MAG: LamG domain-containing protein [Phycisphaeraceae bacterium]
MAILTATPAMAALTHLWTFDTNFTDGVGTANGTAVGDGVSITSTPGQFLVGTGGLRIAHTGVTTTPDAGTDYVSITAPVFPTTNPMQFSLGLLYRFDPTIGVNDSRNFLFETKPGFSIGVGMAATDELQYFLEGTTLSPGPNLPNVNNGQWHQFAAVWDKLSTNTLKIYHDGQLVQHISLGANNFNQASQAGGMNIGTFRGANDRNWVGYIDDFRIHDNAITSSQVAAQFSAIASVAPSTPFSFENNFDGVAKSDLNHDISHPNWILQPSGGLTAGGFSGNFLRTTAVAGDNTLAIQFTDLPDHGGVQLGMLLAQLDSLDPIRDGDRFIVRVDGVEILNAGFGYGVSGSLSEPIVTTGDPVLDAELLSLRTASGVQLFGDVNFLENVYDLSQLSLFQSIKHTGSTLLLEIIGRQNQTAGEFFGIDNLTLTLQFIPEPATMMLLLTAAPVLARRRRRRIA